MKLNINKYLFLLLCVIGNSKLFPQKIEVVLNEILWEINAQTPCDIDKEAVSKVNCECCLVREFHFSDNKDPKEVIQDCDARCTQNEITGFLQKYTGNSDLSSSNAKTMLQYLYNDKLAIKSIPVEKDKFDSRGFPTTDGLKKIFESAVQAGALTSAYFSNVQDDLEIKNISAASGGLATLQLYLLTSKKSDQRFIIKEANSQETKRLLTDRYGSEMQGIRPYVWPNMQSPVLMLPSVTISYKHNDKEHFLLIMPMASGVELRQFLYYYICGQDNDLTRAKKAYERVGASLAKFQKKFADHKQEKLVPDTFIHGDFHHRNIYFDEKNNEV